MRDFRAELDEMLAANGGYYEYSDILECIDNGMMQSFATENTWAVTQVNEFPRKKTVEVVFVVGNYKDLPELEERILSFARDIGAVHLTSAGRDGFRRRPLPGWTQTTTNFVRQVNGA